MSALADMGAKSMLVVNLPDITLAPAYNEGSSYAGKSKQVRALVRQFNDSLEAKVFDGEASVAARYPDLRLFFVDAYQEFNKMIEEQVFDNVEAPWSGTYKYPRTGGYVWWDEWHPMTEAHRRIAKAAEQAL